MAATINTEEILVGIGDLQIDGRPVGLTEGGVTCEMSQDIFGVSGDQIIANVEVYRQGMSMKISTNLQQASLANFKDVWDQKSTIQTDGEKSTLKLGLSTAVTKHELIFIGKSPAGLDRKYTIFIAYISAPSAHSLKKTENTKIPIEFTALPDLSQAENEEWGKIEDYL
jgi:hypothetical protein